jgi:type III pantothenate kinase
MNLTIDIGNTRTKLALFDSEQLVKTQILNREGLDNGLIAFLEENQEIKHVICSAVGAPSTVLATLKISGKLLNLNQNTALPIENLYGTTETLGADRVSNAVGAAHLHPGHHVLIIDMGTCITLDLVTEGNAYLGGSISNGIHMRFEALHTFTENLPLIGHNDSNSPDLIGKTTEDSIRSGVVNGIIAELCGMIEEYNKQFAPLKILVTGGDAAHFVGILKDRADSKKNEIFANPNLVHVGLNAILNYNVKEQLQ